MSHEHIDIVMTLHNALEYARSTVDMLYQHTSNFRLIVVDDHSDEETRQWAYGPDCLGRDRRNLYVRTNRQTWFTRASNVGLRLVETPRAVLLNSDLVFGVGWLEEMFDVWQAAEQQLGRRVGLVGHYGEPEAPYRWRETREPDYVTGHCIMFSMAALQEISVLRGDAGRYLDEVHQDAIHINSDRYASYEMNRAGWATIVTCKAAVGHHGFKSWGANLARVQGVPLSDVD